MKKIEINYDVELFGNILIKGIEKTGLDVVIISSVDGKIYRIIISVINSHVTKPDDNYSISTGNVSKLFEKYCANVVWEKTKIYTNDDIESQAVFVSDMLNQN